MARTKKSNVSPTYYDSETEALQDIFQMISFDVGFSLFSRGDCSKWLEGDSTMSTADFYGYFLEPEWGSQFQKHIRGNDGGPFTVEQVAALVEIVQERTIDEIRRRLQKESDSALELISSSMASAGGIVKAEKLKPAQELVISEAICVANASPKLSNPKLAEKILQKFQSLGDRSWPPEMSAAGFSHDENPGYDFVRNTIKIARESDRIPPKKMSKSTENRRKRQEKN